MHHSLPLLLSSIFLIPTCLAQSGTFTAIAFNVAGLPAFLESNGVPGSKTDNTKRIGQLFNQYNNSLIHVQEDFNYHSDLYSTDQHPYRTATSGGVPFGSGLNTLSDFPFTNFQRIKWNKCSNFDYWDCLTPKGFSFMRVQIGNKAVIDAYNLHADAGDTNADHAARTSNLRQVSDYIKANSNGNAVLVYGDSNSLYTTAADIPSIFTTENGMTNAWVELERSGVAPAPGSNVSQCGNPSLDTSCESLDKLWYRGSSTLQLKATSFLYGGDAFLQTNGNILSDHTPIVVGFTWNMVQKTRALTF